MRRQKANKETGTRREKAEEAQRARRRGKTRGRRREKEKGGKEEESRDSAPRNLKGHNRSLGNLII